jgi:membrane-bound metal-dependent hydrolase YbcI (DUF457 family)
MVIGHFGAAFAAKRVAPNASLGTFVMAVIWLDFYYPYSHSLVAALIWGGLFGFVYFVLRRSWLVAIVLALCVLSHWFLDFAVHRPDMPLTLGNEYKFGLGLWNAPLTTLIVEGLIFVIGLALYWNGSRARDGVGRYALLFLILLLLAIYSTQFLDFTPPSERAIAYMGFAQWLLVALGYWINRHRETIP